MHALTSRYSARPRHERLTSGLLAVALSSMLACGGATTTGPGENTGDAGDQRDASDKPDGADPSDAASDAGRPECDTTFVTCRSNPPPCPAGEIPVVSGTCWAGHCVKPSACRTVRDCTVCPADSNVCARDTGRGVMNVRCVEVPTVCTNDRTCKCLVSYVCTNSPFGSCFEGSGREFFCDCPICR